MCTFHPSQRVHLDKVAGYASEEKEWYEVLDGTVDFKTNEIHSAEEKAEK